MSRTHSNSAKISRRAFFSATALACIACVAPRAAFATTNTASSNSESIVSVNRSGNTIKVTNTVTGETGKITFSNHGETATISYSDGTTSIVERDNLGSVTINGTPAEAVDASVVARATVPAGFTLLSSTRYDFTGMSIVNAILFFASLGMGNAPAVVQFLVSLMGGGASLMPDGYMELDQYVNYNTNKFFNVYRFYDAYGNYQYETTTGPF